MSGRREAGQALSTHPPVMGGSSPASSSDLLLGPEHGSSSAHRAPSPPLGSATDPSMLRLFAISLALGGCQFGWSVQIGYTTKTLQELGMPLGLVSYAWLAGPISGMVVQPLVGSASDRIGLRWPFVATGCALTCAALLAFSHAGSLGVAVVSFFALDFAINAVQGPVRTLLTDAAPAAKLARGNAMMALCASGGNMLGSLAGFVDLASGGGGRTSSLAYTLAGTQLRALYLIAAVFVLVTCAACLAAARGTQARRRNGGGSGSSNANNNDHSGSNNNNHGGSAGAAAATSGAAATASIFTTLRRLQWPRGFRDAFVVQCLSWFAWFTTFIYYTSWVGSDIFHGSASGEDGSEPRRRFDAGVRLGSLAMALQAALAMVLAPLLPRMFVLAGAGRRGVGMKRVYFAAQCLMSVCLAATAVLSAGNAHTAGSDIHATRFDPTLAARVLACIPAALLGFTWAVTMCIPWTIAAAEVVRSGEGAEAGLYLAVLNLSQSAPEILAALAGAATVAAGGGGAAVMALGGSSAAASAVYVLVRKVGESEDADDDELGNAQALMVD